MITNSTLVFVDWDSARRIIRKGAGEPIIRRPDRDIEAAIEALQEEVANVLRPGTQIRRISWRIYHGWHQGTTSTDDRRLFEKFVNGYSSRRVGKLSFGRDFNFGDEMLCASRRRPCVIPCVGVRKVWVQTPSKRWWTRPLLQTCCTPLVMGITMSASSSVTMMICFQDCSPPSSGAQEYASFGFKTRRRYHCLKTETKVFGCQ